MSSCQVITGLYGPQSSAVPVFGTPAALTALKSAVDHGLVVRNATSPRLVESEHAFQIAVQAVVQDNTIFAELDLLSDAHQHQHVSFQNALRGRPLCADAFDINICDFDAQYADEWVVAGYLKILRRLSQLRHDRGERKAIFQVGLLVMSMTEDTLAHFLARVYSSDLGDVTHTIWLYRWTYTGDDGLRREHWRGFAAADHAIQSDRRPLSGSIMQENLEPPLCSPELVPYDPAHRPRRKGQTDQDEIGPQTPLDRPPIPYDRPPKRQRISSVDHWHLSDDEVFQLEHHHIQQDVIFRLAHSYSNKEIFERINAVRPPEQRIKTPNVITKRLTHAYELEARKQGREVDEIRREVEAEKNARGVKHKMKVEVATYRDRQKRAENRGNAKGRVEVGAMGYGNSF
ncbi:hypothetical protein B0A48_11785 [Cryoendolithus antarcticus]|uniref:Uncharacterized protein n=1 Tax=Cryoendolithus antarcticus TaxID=1507870 RepID=A0A1V8ST94_9PEZI|nr:hypothetical protein B0A48_11785 [Cryoendolithus antarcticus]